MHSLLTTGHHHWPSPLHYGKSWVREATSRPMSDHPYPLTNKSHSVPQVCVKFISTWSHVPCHPPVDTCHVSHMSDIMLPVVSALINNNHEKIHSKAEWKIFKEMLIYKVPLLTCPVSR